MITHQSPAVGQRSWFVAIVGGLAVGVAMWWWHGAAEDDDAGAGAAPSAVVDGALGGALGGAARSADASGALSAQRHEAAHDQDDRPADFSPKDWAALKLALSRLPNGKAEMRRVVSYLRFQRNLERWQALDEPPGSPLRREFAQTLLAQIPERLARADLSKGEALLLGSALLSDIEPDEGRRLPRLRAFQRQLEDAAPSDAGEQRERAAQQLAEYKRRQAALVQEWQARPAASRDPAKLERDLAEARRSVYGNP